VCVCLCVFVCVCAWNTWKLSRIWRSNASAAPSPSSGVGGILFQGRVYTVCMYICMHACIYVCMYVWMDGWMYGCTGSMYVCMLPGVGAQDRERGGGGGGVPGVGFRAVTGWRRPLRRWARGPGGLERRASPRPAPEPLSLDATCIAALAPCIPRTIRATRAGRAQRYTHGVEVHRHASLLAPFLPVAAAAAADTFPVAPRAPTQGQVPPGAARRHAQRARWVKAMPPHRQSLLRPPPPSGGPAAGTSGIGARSGADAAQAPRQTARGSPGSPGTGTAGCNARPTRVAPSALRCPLWSLLAGPWRAGWPSVRRC